MNQYDIETLQNDEADAIDELAAWKKTVDESREALRAVEAHERCQRADARFPEFYA